MKITFRNILVTVAGLAAFFLSDTCQAAGKRPRKDTRILDGSAVNVGAVTKAVPVESKMDDGSRVRPGITDFKPTKTVYLYPEGQKNLEQGIVENGVAVTLGPKVSNEIQGPEIPNDHWFIDNVSDSARIDIYIPKEPNGQMAIVCPGGSYKSLSIWNEGVYVAKWMNDRGIACAVAKYRLPNGHREVPLIDIQNAFRYCRHHAEEWGVKQIGVVGFSAGGHLATTVETMYVDEVTRPDFAMAIYPVVSMEDGITHGYSKSNLLGTNPRFRAERQRQDFDGWRERADEYDGLSLTYSSERNVTPDTPPTFIGVSTNDGVVPVKNSIRFYQALVRNNVPVELHAYPYGKHGWGFTDHRIGLEPKSNPDGLGNCRLEFTEAAERWLSQLAQEYGGKLIEQNFDSIEKRHADKTILLYPEGQASGKGVEGGAGDVNGILEPETEKDHHTLWNTSDSARFDLYIAKNPNGKMVVVCPGGAYSCTAIYNEGQHVAEWLNSQGVSAAVLKYRLPNGHWTVPLTDVWNTFRYCRHHASEWGVKEIGVMGFSAGGHLAASASTLYVDAETRPDFSILIYPVISSEAGVTHEGSVRNLIGQKEKWEDRKGKSFNEWNDTKALYEELLDKYSLDKQVTMDTPPTFIALSSDDKAVVPENEVRYYDALVANKVPCELHSYPTGGHGWGFVNDREDKDGLAPYRANFYHSLARFIRELR